MQETDSPALMMEAIRSSDSSVLTKNTRRKISEDGFLYDIVCSLADGTLGGSFIEYTEQVGVSVAL
jgi:hypothetical protein